VTPPEACDDNNTNDGDTCTADCACGADNPDIIAFPLSTDGHCYMLFKISKTWPAIAGYCSDVEAEAAAITTDKERMFVGGYLNQSVWIGGTDLPGEWEWNNSEPWLIKPCDAANQACENNVDFWVSGEPNGGAYENCLEFKGDSDKFNDVWCLHSLPFLCEKAP
jgi:hypothetical protein